MAQIAELRETVRVLKVENARLRAELARRGGDAPPSTSTTPEPSNPPNW